MALALKGTRRITIDGVDYRWVVAPDDGYMSLVAERADDPGRRLEAYFDYHDVYEPAPAGSSRIIGQLRSVSPGVVEVVLRAALRRGRQSSSLGLPPFQVHDADQLVPIDPPDASRAIRMAGEPSNHYRLTGLRLTLSQRRRRWSKQVAPPCGRPRRWLRVKRWSPPIQPAWIVRSSSGVHSQTSWIRSKRSKKFRRALFSKRPRAR